MVHLIPLVDVIFFFAPGPELLFLYRVYPRARVYDAGAFLLPDAFVLCSLVLLEKLLRLEVSKASSASDEKMIAVEMFPGKC